MTAPVGTTHVLPADPTGFDQTPTYMKWGYDFTGPESGTRYHCWFNWYRDQWCKDTSFANRHNRLLTIEDYQ